MTKRVEYIDTAKGIGILLVYIGHSFLDPDGALFQSIYSFHMPLFFFISGLLFPSSSNVGITKTIYRKATSLLLPYLLFSILYISIFGIMGEKPIGYLLRGWGKIPLWFIPILFIIEVMHLLLLYEKKVLKTFIVFIVSILFFYKVSTNGWLPYCVSEIPWFYLCFASGYLLKRHTPDEWTVFHCKDSEKKDRYKLLLVGGFFVIGQIILFSIVIPYNSNFRLQDNDLLSYIMRYTLGMIGTVSVLLISSGIADLKFFKLLKWLGLNSLVILCVHWLPLHAIYSRVIFPCNHALIWIVIVVSTFVYNSLFLP